MFPDFRRILLLISCLLLPLTAVGAVTSSEPVKISADSLDLDQKSQTTTYSGNVLLTQGKMKLTADSLKVFVSNGKLGKIESHGNPTIFQTVLDDGTTVRGEAKTIIFDSAAGRLTLTGNGKLSQGGNMIENDHITYDLKTGALKAGGKHSKKRVEVIFQPAQ